jgi:Ca2+-binding RTX toxin-like protein
VSGAGDAAADAVTVNGTAGAVLVNVTGGAGSVTLTLLSLTLAILRAEPTNDTLAVNLSSGADLFSASGLASTSVALTGNGGAGNDILVGSQGGDTIDGGADADYIAGGAGIDTAFGGETLVNVP